MECSQCSGTISGGRCTRCGRQGYVGGASGGGNAVSWPFHQPGLLGNLWMPLAASFLWPFGIMIGLGWSVDAVGRRARSDSQPSPRTKDLAKILKHGFVVMAMYTIYFVIPLSILVMVVEFSWVVELGHLAGDILRSISGGGKESVQEALVVFFTKLLSNALAPAVYIAVVAPLFLAARLRYAITGKVRSFFNLPANIMFCFRHVGEVLLYLFLATVARVASTTILVALAWTVVGAVIPLLMGAANIWILAYLAGDLARVMREQDGVGMRALPAVVLTPELPPLQVQQPMFYGPPELPANLSPVMPMLPTPPAVVAALPSPQLYCCLGPLKDRQFPVVASGYFIGRSPSVSQVIVRLREVSSRHVRVEADPDEGGVWIEDMGSTNGTFYSVRSGPWQRLSGRVRLPYGGRFRLSKDAAEFEVRVG